jgi:signal transduction histidine kinase
MSGDTGELARRVAHAIRTPMGVVGGVLEQLRDTANPALDRARLIELGDRGLAQIGRIADRLGLLGAIERGLDPKPQSADLGELAAGAIAEIGRARRRKGVEVTSSRSGGEAKVSCDPALMRAAIAELVDNAVRFARTRVTVETDGRTLSIANDGPPVEPATLVGLTGTRPLAADRAGLGIGLWMAGCIVAAHTGSIDHEAADGRVVFHLRLAP